MKRYLFLLLASVVLLTGCVKNETELEFNLPADFNTPVRMLYYASDKKQGKIVETVAEINGGKGTIKLPMYNSSIVFLFSPSSRDFFMMFYAERGGKVKITGMDTDVMAWNVEGNDLNKKWSEWRIANKAALESRSEEKINAAVEQYVKKNPESELSLVLLMLRYSRYADPAGFSRLYALLKPKAYADKKLMDALSAGDLLEGVSPLPKALKDMVLTGEDGYADTLRLSSGRPSIIYMVSSRNRNMADETLDSVKAFVRVYPDSTRYIIAEINADPDTMQWRRAIRKDTVRNIHRLWLPTGVASVEAREMGATRVPYYVVADGKGKRLYGGSELKEAFRHFRKTMAESKN